MSTADQERAANWFAETIAMAKRTEGEAITLPVNIPLAPFQAAQLAEICVREDMSEHQAVAWLLSESNAIGDAYNRDGAFRKGGVS